MKKRERNTGAEKLTKGQQPDKDEW